MYVFPEENQEDAWAVAIGELSSHRSDSGEKVPKSFQNRFEAQQKILKVCDLFDD